MMRAKTLVAVMILIVVIVATIVGVTHRFPANTNLSQDIDKYLNTYRDSFSGTVLVAKEGKIVFEKGYGMSDYVKNIPNTTDTKFRIGSITKQFTAMAIMQLQEKGLLNVNDNLGKYLPQDSNWKNVTIKELLTHTSGIPGRESSMPPNTLDNLEPLQNMIGRIQNKPLDFPSGTKWAYNDSNYLILSYLVEKLSGLPYEDYLKKNIFEPLHMNHTGLYTPQVIQKVATGYLITGANPSTAARVFTYGDGGLYSTVQDIYNWDMALDTNKLVSSQSLKQIFTPQVHIGAGASYGYGWIIIGTGINEEVYHAGTLDGYTSFNVRYPEKNIELIVLTNSSSNSSPLDEVLNGLQSIAAFGINPTPPSVQNKPMALTQKEAQSYIGKYEYSQPNSLPSTEFMTITENNNQLFADNDPLQLVSKSNGHAIFKSTMNSKWVIFNMNFMGKVKNAITVFGGVTNVLIKSK